MPYDDLLNAERIRPLTLTADEQARRVRELLGVAERELSDAKVEGVSTDGRHNNAYSAARTAAEAVMTAEGYRRGPGAGQHVTVFQFLAEVSAGRWEREARYFGHARRLRHTTEYERAGVISESAAADMISTASQFIASVRDWLAEERPEFTPREEQGLG